MGGTTTDVCLVLDGEPRARRRAVSRRLRRCGCRRSTSTRSAPAAGRSRASTPVAPWSSARGSAGAEPGPACYGHGGTGPRSPTPTSSAGRIPADGRVRRPRALDADAARRRCDAAGVTADGVHRGGRRRDGAGAARGLGRAGRRSPAASRSWPSAAPGRCTPARWPTRSTWPRSSCRPRAGVLSAVGLLTSPLQRRPGPLVADARSITTARRRGRGCARLARRAAGPRSATPGPRSSTALDCRYEGQSHELTVPSVADFHDGARAPQRLRPPRRAGRGRRPAGHGHRSPSRARRSRDLPAVERRRAAGPDRRSPSPTARSGSRRLAGRARRRRRPRAAKGRTREPRPGRAAGADLATRRDRRRDGRGAAAVRVQPEHQGAGRLLGGACSRPTATCWRRPSTSRSTSARCRRRCARPSTPTPAELGPGEQVLVNDPFAGGTHLNDITVVTPAFVGGQLVGWVANRAHHADVGGAAPGSIPADATEIQQEGFRIPPVRLQPARCGACSCAASRTPDERAGDLDAQVGANVVGAARLGALVDQPLDEVVAYGERRMRAALAALPDGTWTFEDVLDSTGSAPDQQRPATHRRSRSPSTGDEITFDFTGTDPQARRQRQRGRGGDRVVGRVRPALRDRSDHPGQRRRAAPGARDRARRAPSWRRSSPPPVGAGNVEVSQRVADVCLGALAQALPGPGRRRRPGHDEQRAHRWRRLGVLRDGGGRRRAASRARSGHERRPHRHDQLPEHADRGAGAGLPDAGAPLPAAGGERRRGPLAGRRGHRARPRGARGLHGR